MSRIGTAALLTLATLGFASGCGFVGASDVSHNKPSGFVLRGYATTPVPAGDTRADGSACAAPASLTDIVAGATVKVTDPDNTVIGLGVLGPGVIAHAGTVAACDFPFQIRAVPGGVDTYSVAVGTHPAVTFPANELREDKPAIIPLTS